MLDICFSRATNALTIINESHKNPKSVFLAFVE